MEEYISEELKTLIQAINEIKDLDDEFLTDEVSKQVIDGLKEGFVSGPTEQIINQVIQSLEQSGATTETAAESVSTLKEALKEVIYGKDILVGNKKKIIDEIVNGIFTLFDQVLEKYHKYSIVLPMHLEEGAQIPTYAHDTDAAADIYALEDSELPAHSYGNKLRTGVSIELPEGWLAFILPRSSIGAKTTMRLSNSVGLIDSGYRGELGVLYDNTSDNVASVKKGDRIAQLLVMPSYRFKAVVKDSLNDSDRGTGGFGSTGA